MNRKQLIISGLINLITGSICFYTSIALIAEKMSINTSIGILFIIVTIRLCWYLIKDTVFYGDDEK